MTIQHLKPDLEPAVHVNNKCISTVQSYEYLGMYWGLPASGGSCWEISSPKNQNRNILGEILYFISNNYQKTQFLVSKICNIQYRHIHVGFHL